MYSIIRVNKNKFSDLYKNAVRLQKEYPQKFLLELDPEFNLLYLHLLNKEKDSKNILDMASNLLFALCNIEIKDRKFKIEDKNVVINDKGFFMC